MRYKNSVWLELLVFLTWLLLVVLCMPADAQEIVPIPDGSAILNLDQVIRPSTKTLSTEEEDRAFFQGKTERADRELIVLIKQSEMSLADSKPDFRVIHKLTVHASNGECYGFCDGFEPELTTVGIEDIKLTTLQEEYDFFQGETDPTVRNLLVRIHGSLETIRIFSENPRSTSKVTVRMYRVYTSNGTCYGECAVTEDVESPPLKNEA